MRDCIVDANVLVVANGRNTNASRFCREKSILFLSQAISSWRLNVDDSNEIMAEYRSHCNSSGQPGVGDRFYQLLLSNYTSKVRRTTLTKEQDGTFSNFPRNPDLDNFDISDRKYVALAVTINAPVFNSTDTDWINHKAALNESGVEIEFLCSDDVLCWFA